MTSGMSQNNETSKTIWMVVSASLAFVILVSPLAIYGSIIVLTNKTTILTDPIVQILEVINRINPAINGYLYFMCGSLFRAEVKKLMASIGCCK